MEKTRPTSSPPAPGGLDWYGAVEDRATSKLVASLDQKRAGTTGTESPAKPRPRQKPLLG